MTGSTVIDRVNLAELLLEFGLGELTQPLQPADPRGTSFRLETSRGSHVLRLDEAKGELELKRELELLLYLARNGFPAPQPLPDRRGRHYRVSDGICASVHRALAGTQHRAPALSLVQLEDVGRVLADLHAVAKVYKKGIENRFGFERLAAMYTPVRDRMPAWFRRTLRTLDDEIEYLRHYLEHKLPKGIVHGDVRAEHLRFDGDRVVGLLGFEAAARGKFIYDLATAVNALCFRPGAGYDLTRFEALVAGYEGVRPLCLAEWDAFPNELRFSALRFTITALRELPAHAPDAPAAVDTGFREFYERLQILRREREGGMEALLMAMATGYDYRKYQRVKPGDPLEGTSPS